MRIHHCIFAATTARKGGTNDVVRMDDCLCLECFREMDVRCSGCLKRLCDGCDRVECCAPRCSTIACVDCMAAEPADFTRCDDCGAYACDEHTAICTDCTDAAVLPAHACHMDVRVMMRCCACKRTLCASCESGPDGEAGARVTDAGALPIAWRPPDFA